MQRIPQNTIFLLCSLQQLNEGLNLPRLAVLSSSCSQLPLQLLYPSTHLLILFALVIGLLFILVDYLQKIIYLLFSLGYMSIFLSGELLVTIASLSCLFLCGDCPAICFFELQLDMLQTDCQFLLVLEQFGDEFDIIIHHNGQFFLLLLQSAFQLRLQDMLELIKGCTQTMILFDELVMLLQEIILILQIARELVNRTVQQLLHRVICLLHQQLHLTTHLRPLSHHIPLTHHCSHPHSRMTHLRRLSVLYSGLGWFGIFSALF